MPAKLAAMAKKSCGIGGALILLVFLISLPGVGQSSDQPLGDVVRQKPAHQAAHVITNDDIPSVTIPTSESLAAAPTPGGNERTNDGSEAAPGATETTAPNQLKSGITIPGVLTNGSIEDARAALETLKHDRQAFITNYDKIQRRLDETDDQALQQTYRGILATRDSTLAKNAKAIADTESAIRAAENARQGNSNEIK